MGESLKVCPICGTQFSIEGKHSRKYCSVECREKSERKGPLVKRCAYCDEQFIAKNAEKFCSDKCRALADKMRRADMARKDLVKEKKKSKPNPCDPMNQPSWNKKCRTCRYSFINGLVICQYILVTGESRGCEGGENCIRYEKRNGKKLNGIVYGGTANVNY